MQEAWVPGALTMIFGTLLGLQGVSSNETVNNCEDLHCPKGFRCCGNECCHESKILDPENDPLKIVFITLLVIIVLLCICSLVMSKCKQLHHDLRAADHQTPPDAHSIAPLESIWVTSLDPLPTYSQVGLSVPIPNVFHSWLSNLLK
ncbi:transmembrane protein 92-like [Rattus norvegicus]|uniref:transmembrane protein 92-like n=1 Tax=Rattus norvegicus TaxID=10116 RepID=UPI0019175DBF|nr:transmembrane protein 92-like [Rattus norvegicus]